MDMNMQTFEELQRHQLVTEFDIQSQSELEDYQVQLENVDNPTQAQDNLVVSVDGEALPHWNESVDFDTWVKMRIETSGKRGLLIHGNVGSSSGSSITDTMVFGDDFNTGSIPDTLKWDNPSANNYAVSSGVLQVRGVSVPNPNIVGKTAYALGHTIHWRTKVNNINDNTMVGFTTITSGRMDYTVATNENVASLLHFEAASDWFGRYCADDTSVYDSSAQLGTEDLNYHTYEIEYASSHLEMFQDGVTIWNPSTNLPTHDMYPFVQSWGTGSTQDMDYIFITKYASNKPTYTISTPKNISTALKSFGRAG